MKFMKILQTFHPKENITLTAQDGILRIEGFEMSATKFSPVAVPPAEFQVFPVRDGWVAPSDIPKPAPPPESRWLKARWWE